MCSLIRSQAVLESSQTTDPSLPFSVRGTLKLQDGNNHVILLYVEGGFAEVKDNKVIILTPKAELAEHIDVKKWEAVRDEAAARLTRPGVLTDIEHTEKTLRRAEARLKTANLMGHVAPYEWET